MVNNTSFILYFACVFLLTAAGFGMVAISLNDFPALLLKCCICEKLLTPPSGRESFLLSLLTSLILAIFAKRTAKEVKENTKGTFLHQVCQIIFFFISDFNCLVLE